MKRTAAIILIIIIVLGMSSTLLISLRSNKKTPVVKDVPVSNTESGSTEYPFIGPPAGPPQVTGPTSEPGR